jgi:hypothetical protein
MSSNEQVNIKSQRGVYDTCDPAYLRELRKAAGMELAVLARTACLSVAQVRELETDDSDELFYSDAIKRQAYKRLLMILGAEPPTVDVPEELRDASKVAQAHLNTLDQIVAMSHQPAINRSITDRVGSGVAKLKAHKQVLGALLLLAGAVGLFVWHGFEPAGGSVALTPSEPVREQEPSRLTLVSASPSLVAASAASSPAPVAATSAPTDLPVPIAAASVATSAVSLSAAASSAANKASGLSLIHI